MLNIARRQLVEGILDAKFIFLSLLILVAFIANGLVFSEKYKNRIEDYRDHVRETGSNLEGSSSNLQDLAVFNQRVLQPVSPLCFVAEGGSGTMPNIVRLHAFNRFDVEFQHRENEFTPALPQLDWAFIIGVLVSLLAILISYGAIAGEKKSGTLRLLLSQPVSRLKVFTGKYLGLLLALLISIFFGIGVNLATIFFVGEIPLTGETLWPIGWVLLLTVLYASSFVLLGLMVSALTRHPPVSLVILLMIWVLVIFAVPGIGRLIAEQTVEVPSQAKLDEAETNEQDEVWENRARNAANWSGDPFEPHVPTRMELSFNQHAVIRKYFDMSINAQIEQAKTANTYSALSPYGLISDSFQYLSGTGVHGFETLHRNARKYREILYQFVVERDRIDSKTPHLVYGWITSYDPGVFSQEPVAMSMVPRAHALWSETGQAEAASWPFIQIIHLLAGNLQLAIIGFIALACYDPR